MLGLLPAVPPKPPTAIRITKMAEESKPVPPNEEPSKAPAPNAAVESDESGSEVEATLSGAAAMGAKKKKKNKKKNKAKGEQAQPQAESQPQDVSEGAGVDIMRAVRNLPPSQLNELLRRNPALYNQLQAEGSSPSSLADALKNLKLEDLMTGLATSGKNVKDTGSSKFWHKQPVPQFGEKPVVADGPRQIKKLEDIKTEPAPLAIEGFRWVTLDLTNDEELAEVTKLLEGHYVEDDAACFRLKYSKSMIKWYAVMSRWGITANAV